MYIQNEINNLVRNFSLWCTYVQFSNKNGYNDINKISEEIVRYLLNALYEYKLENANSIQANFPAIDLYYDKEKIAIQVTSDTSSNKIKKTLKGFTENKYDQKYSNGIKFFYLTTNQLRNKKTDYSDIYSNFNFEKDVITCKHILDKANELMISNPELISRLNDNIEYILKGVKLEDEKMNRFLRSILFRPAFIVHFSRECDCKNFIKAIDDTISAISTGKLQDRNGVLITEFDINSLSEANKIKQSKLIIKLNNLRKVYYDLEKNENIKHCGSVMGFDDFAIYRMNDLREKIIEVAGIELKKEY